MRSFALLVAALAVYSLAAAHDAHAEAPELADRVVIKKGAHTLTLMHGAAILKTYKVAIGPGGAGPKHREGDMTTPVGHYKIDWRAPSQFHVFMHVSYPNADDQKRFAEMKAKGEVPATATIGGDIGIHGAPGNPAWKTTHKTVDWTAGCIAVDDLEIEEISKLVPYGTAVDIDD
ncbi:hypothetical protein BH09MYX1_BH09MYX1_58050 [soil metagenome]